MKSPISDALPELRRQFAEQLSTRLGAIRSQFQHLDPSAWRPAEAEALHRLVHGLAGSAGTFGMQSVSDAARALEIRLAALLKAGTAPNATEWPAIGADLDRLEKLSRIRLESDAPSLKPPPPPPRIDRSPLIHLVEDDATQAEHLSQALREDGYRVRIFTAPAEFRAACATDAERPAAVVMDMIFPEGDAAGAALIAELGLGKHAGIPVAVASVRDDLAGRLAAFRAGACRYLVKPVEAGRLIDLLDALTGRQPPQPYRVLLVDDDPLLLDAHAAVLRAAGMEVHTLSQPLRLMEALNGFAPDVVVLDVYMPEASGPELAAVLRERDANLHLPILFLSAETDMTRQLLALNLGGDDFLVKPVQPDHLVAAVAARARRARQNSALRQRLETTLYEREREHLALNQHAIVSIADRAGNITYINDKFCEISGYARGELLGQNHRILKSGQHPPEFYQNLWSTIAGGRVWRGEICNRRKDGGLYWVESTITPFLDGEGKPYQYVSIRTDISHVKAAEAALERHKDRLRRGQLFANIGTWDWNIQSGDLFWTERIAPLFGYPVGELETSYTNFISAMHPDDRQAVIDAVNACVERDAPYEIEHRVVWPDGTVRWLLERGAVVRDADGKALQMLGVVQDIDERKRTEQALIAAREEADRANQAKSEFLSSMSHELRTPMNAILGFGQLMEYDTALPDEHRDNVHEILKAGRHLLELIDEVLDLAKVESGHIDLSLEPVDVCSVVEECLSLVGTLAARRDIRLSHGGLKGAAVRADRTRLKQVLLNLLSNAIKYNREGGSVRVEMRPEGADRLRIRVADTGQGIPAERLKELFQPFNRLDAEHSDIEGTGIGLTITRRIVEMMGGAVDVESEPGVGSTFWVELPLEPAPRSDDARHAHAPADGATSAQDDIAMQHTVLYIEDNPANIKLVARILGRREHIHLLTAHTPELGIELALARRPELILLDVNMPGMDGYQVLEVLKAEASLKSIPVIAITANAMPRDIERGMAAGFVDYLPKPLDVARFNAAIDRLLGRAEGKT